MGEPLDMGSYHPGISISVIVPPKARHYPVDEDKELLDLEPWLRVEKASGRTKGLITSLRRTPPHADNTEKPPSTAQKVQWRGTIQP